jgi:predicted AlkP superfamily pyrophosphatase or phosphodiesterase
VVLLALFFVGADSWWCECATRHDYADPVSAHKSTAFAYVYINELDVAGHSCGVGSDEWLAALRFVDSVAES